MSKDNIEAIYPLSPMQEGMLFHSLTDRDSTAYFEQYLCTYAGDFDAAAFRQAWERVVERHPVLRTLVMWKRKDKSLQVVRSRVELEWTIEDWRALPRDQLERKLAEFLRADRARGFDFTEAPLMRFALLRLADNAHRFVWSFHHLLLDGWSGASVLNEVYAFYQAARDGVAIAPPRPRPYRDYIAWLQKQDLSKAEAFWKQRLAGFSAPTPLHVGRGAPPGARATYEREVGRLAEAATGALKALSRRHRLTLNTVVQGAWAMVLSRYSGEDDVVFGATVAGRPPELDGVEQMVGLFINTLPVRVRLPADETLITWLQALQAQQLEARDYEYSPLYRVQRLSEIPRGQPLFESIVVFENYPSVASPPGDRGFAVEDVYTHEETNFPLTIGVEPAESLLIRATYDSVRFDAETIRRLLGHLGAVLEGIAADSQRKLRDVDILTGAERRQLLIEWNATQAEVSAGVCVHHRFAVAAGEHPDAIALVAPDGRMTYGELDRKTAQLAHYLRARGVGPDVIVGVCLERSLDLIVGILGIVRAGGAYLPMDPQHPADRLVFMLQDAGAPMVLTQRSLLGALSGFAGATPCLDRDWNEIAAQPPEAPPQITPAHLAYVIYTSGSTGKPKGVAIPHAGLMNLVTWHQRAYGVTRADRATLLAGLAFDASVWELWPYLTAGASLYLAEEDVRLSPSRILRWFAESQITVSFLPTPLAEAVLAEPVPVGLALKYLLTGGDKLHSPPTRALPFRLYNHYGPTENSVVTTAAEIPPVAEGAARPPTIGRPIANTRVYLLDKLGRPVPIGVPGELYASGVGLARGYVNRPDLNETAFLPNPFDEGGGTRLYRTGDLARYGADGSIEFLGRMDDQVKLHGYRIELGEIEAVLCRHGGVKDAVAMVREDVPGEKKLVAYVVPASASLDAGELRAYLKAALPVYMVPAFLVPMATLPLTANGKVDRRALPVPAADQRLRPQTPTAPASEVEKTLCGIFAAVLRVDDVGVHDNFFELGGDSILSIQVIARAHEANLHLSPKDLFRSPTVAELAQIADRGTRVAAEQGKVTGPVPLTPIQTWFFEQAWPVPQHWNQAYLLETPTDVDVRSLEQSVLALTEHHDALRMRYEKHSGGWRQINGAESPASVFVRVDLSRTPVRDRAAALERAAASLQAGLSLEQGKLLQAAYFHFGPGSPGRLLIAIHHLVVDGVSWRILLEDLERAYRQQRDGRPVGLPPKTTSFKQWSERLCAYANSPAVAQELAFWQGASEAPHVSLPVDYAPAGGNIKASARSWAVELDARHTAALLQQVPSVYNTQINDVLLTALARTLTVWARRPAIAIDLEGHGREDIGTDIDVSRTVGWFTSLSPVTLRIEEAAPGRALKSIKEQLRQIPRRGIGYGLLRYLHQDEATRNAMRNSPRPQALFNYLGQFDQTFAPSRLFRPAAESSGSAEDAGGTRTHLLEINALIVDGRLRLEWTFSEQVHKRATVAKLARNYLQHLRELIAHCLKREAGGFTPSDFPRARITMPQLDRLYAARGKNIEDLYPLSSLQQGMLYQTLAAPDSGVSFEQYTFRLRGDLNARALAAAWQTVVDRHQALRGSFVWEELPEPHQVICRQVPLSWEYQDWRGAPQAEQHARLKAYRASDRAKGFDLAQAPLMRFALLRTAEDAWYFIWSFHHILIDGWSMNLVLHEVGALYDAAVTAQEPALSRPRPFGAYIEWLSRQDLAEAEAYWREALKGFDAPSRLRLGRSRKATGAASNSNAEQELKLSAATTAALHGLARRHGVTLNAVVRGAWALLIGWYSGRDDVVFGATVAGRPAAIEGVEKMAGMFINNLPVRVRIDRDMPLTGWLRRIQEQQIEMQRYEFTPLGRIQKWSEVPRNQPLFESLLVFENYPFEASPAATLNIEQVDLQEKTSYPINVIVTPGRELGIHIAYDSGAYEPAVVGRLLAHLENLLAGMTRGDPNVGDLTPMSRADREKILVEWNAAAEAPPEQLVHRAFEDAAARAPQAVAVACGGESLTYEQLNRRVNQLANFLCARGIGPGAVVGLCVDSPLLLLQSLLGILKAGATCLPLDPRDPSARRTFALTDSNASLLLVQSSAQEIGRQVDRSVVSLDGEREAILKQRADSPTVVFADDEPAFIFYVPGGHGGPPLGVQVPHRSVVNALCGVIARVGLTSADTHAGLFAYRGSHSVLELLLPLLAAARLVLRPDQRSGEGTAVELLRRAPANVLSATPTELRKLWQAGWQVNRGMKVLCSGEVPPGELAEALTGRGAEFYTLYGTEETGTWTLCHRYIAGDDGAVIGRPLGGARICLLDSHKRPVPSGIAGEIHVGGPALAHGYLNQPRFTALRFNVDLSLTDVPTPLFGTGDLASYRADGTIEYFGGLDERAWVNGVRVEPAEVAARVADHEAVARATVIARRDGAGDARLIAYYGVRTGHDVTAAGLRKHLRQHLPPDAIPHEFIEVADFPMTSDGRIKRAALGAHAVAPDGGNGRDAAPRTDTEKRIAAVWRALLDVERVGLNDNFFELGGHSLLAMQVIADIEAATGVRVSARTLTMNTLQQIAALCAAPRPRSPMRQWLDKIRRASAGRAAAPGNNG